MAEKKPTPRQIHKKLRNLEGDLNEARAKIADQEEDLERYRNPVPLEKHCGFEYLFGEENAKKYREFKTFQALMKVDSLGLTPLHLALKAYELLNAKKMQFVGMSGRPVELPDNATQVKALDLLCSVGGIKIEKIEHSAGEGANVEFVVHVMQGPKKEGE
jgi:hypothetical protein